MKKEELHLAQVKRYVHRRTLTSPLIFGWEEYSVAHLVVSRRSVEKEEETVIGILSLYAM